MANIIYDVNGTNIIDFDASCIVVPVEYPILNPEIVPVAQSAWVCSTRFRIRGLPQYTIWLAEHPYENTLEMNQKPVMETFFEKLNVSPEERALFNRWYELCDRWESGERSDELSAEILTGEHNAFLMFKICAGSIGDKFYFPKSTGDENNV